MLYDSANCPCTNVNYDLYKNCRECIGRHHASETYPMTSCEICEKEGFEKANPVSYFTNE